MKNKFLIRLKTVFVISILLLSSIITSSSVILDENYNGIANSEYSNNYLSIKNETDCRYSLNVTGEQFNQSLMPGCQITGCCNSTCSILRVCCRYHTCVRFTFLCLLPPCCLEWATGYYCDCYPSNALPQTIIE